MNKEPAQKIIAALINNRGFISWWSQIHEDDRGDIIQEIAAIIDEHIEYNYC